MTAVLKIVEALTGTDLKAFTDGFVKWGATSLVKEDGTTLSPLTNTELRENPIFVDSSTLAKDSTISGLSNKIVADSKTEKLYVSSFITIPPATPTDMITIVGSSTKTIRIKRIILTPSQTTLGRNRIFITKRSSDNVGGTFTNSTIVPTNSTFPLPTANIRQYTVNPTLLGNTVGNVRADLVLTPALTSVVNSIYELDFTNNGVNNGIDLIGSNEILSVNLNGVALPAGLIIRGTVEFSEI